MPMTENVEIRPGPPALWYITSDRHGRATAAELTGMLTPELGPDNPDDPSLSARDHAIILALLHVAHTRYTTTTRTEPHTPDTAQTDWLVRGRVGGCAPNCPCGHVPPPAP